MGDRSQKLSGVQRRTRDERECRELRARLLTFINALTFEELRDLAQLLDFVATEANRIVSEAKP